jgi:hypothetical protein
MVNLEELGYLSGQQIKSKIEKIKALQEIGLAIYPCHGFTAFGCDCGKEHSSQKEWGKHPARTASHLLATCNAYATQTWWDCNPRSNVAVNPKSSKKVVVDIDPRSHGDVSLERLLEEHRIALPRTWKTLTGPYKVADAKETRGYHLWFNMTNDFNFPANLDSLGYPGIDIKYNGGVMVPPSKHPLGGEYEWDNGYSPFDVACQDIPSDFLNLILSARTQRPEGKPMGFRFDFSQSEEIVGRILDVDLFDGGRNVEFYAIACKVAYWKGCYTDAQIEAVFQTLLEFNQERVHPPLDERDNVLTQINRAVSYVRAGQGYV